MEYIYSILIQIGIYIILASSFNLVIGYGGLISIAHPIFFAMGGYTSGLVTIHFDLPIFVGILLGAGFPFVASIFLSLPSLRVSGDYLLIASIGFQLGLLQVINNLEFTGAAAGLYNISELISGDLRGPLYTALVLGLAALVVWGIRWMVSGDYGRAITAMRDDETAFTSLGRNSMNIKITLFAVASGLAGLAGGLYAHYFLYLSPEQFDILQSAAILTMVVVGGMGTTWGPVVGAVLLVALPQAITFLQLPPNIMAPLQGIIFTLMVLLFLFLRPQGLVGGSRRAGERAADGETAAEPAATEPTTAGGGK